MRESTMHVVNTLKRLTVDIASRSKTPEQAKAEFTKNVSQLQLEECLTDDDMDESDLRACKEMLKYFYNYEPTVN